MLSALNTLVKEVTDNIEKFELGLAAQKIYDFIWDVYCDWYIEIAKLRLYGEDEGQAENARRVLVYVLQKRSSCCTRSCRSSPRRSTAPCPAAARASWSPTGPSGGRSSASRRTRQGFTDLVELIKAMRAVRAEMGVHPARKTSIFIQTGSPAAFETGRSYLEKFAAASEIEIGETFSGDACRLRAGGHR